MTGDLLASLGFTAQEISNLGGEAAVRELEAGINENIEAMKSKESPSSSATPQARTPATVTRATVTPTRVTPATGKSATATRVAPLSEPTNIQQLLASNVPSNGITNLVQLPNLADRGITNLVQSPGLADRGLLKQRNRPASKFKIGDWVRGTDDEPGQIKSVYWSNQESLYRYQTVTHFGEDTWAETQLRASRPQIAGPPGEVGSAVSDAGSGAVSDAVGGGGSGRGSGGGYFYPAQPDLAEDVSIPTGSRLDIQPIQPGPLVNYLVNIGMDPDNTGTDLGSGGNVMANGDLGEGLGEGPFSRYLRRRGVGPRVAGIGPVPQGISLGSRAGRHISGQWESIENLMKIMEVMRKATGRGFDEEGIYQQGFGLDEFAPMAGTVRERANLGGSALQDLFGMTNEEREDAGLTFENTFINDERQTPTFELKWLQDLIRAGTRGSAGRYGSSFLANRLPYMQAKFDLHRGTPGTATNFVDYFKNRFGL